MTEVEALLNEIEQLTAENEALKKQLAAEMAKERVDGYYKEKHCDFYVVYGYTKVIKDCFLTKQEADEVIKRLEGQQGN